MLCSPVHRPHSSASFASPEVEFVSRSGVEAISIISSHLASDTDIDKVAGPLYESLLSKSSFADLKINSIRPVDSNHNGSEGWREYALDLWSAIG